MSRRANNRNAGFQPADQSTNANRGLTWSGFRSTEPICFGIPLPQSWPFHHSCCIITPVTHDTPFVPFVFQFVLFARIIYS